MKKIVILLIAMSIQLLSSCVINGRPPIYSINNPNSLVDTSGNIVVTYQINSGDSRFTYIQNLADQGNRLWGDEGVELYFDSGKFQGSGEHFFASLINDDEGNIMVIYPLAHTIRIQKLTMEGKTILEPINLYANNPVFDTSVKAVSDNSNGAIIAWIEGENNINIHRLNSMEDILWQRTISTPGIDQFNMVYDSFGNTFILWKDNPGYSEANIFLEKLDSNGTVTWAMKKLPLYDPSSPSYTSETFANQFISDNDGGVIAIWVQPVHSEDGHITSQKLFAQRVNADGEPLWKNGVIITGTNSKPTNVSEPSIINNNLDYTIFWTNGQHIQAQRIDINGNTLWAEGGITQTVSSKKAVYYYPTSSNNAGEVALVWNCTENGNNVIRAQKLDSSGSKQWGVDGIILSSVSSYWTGYAAPACISPIGTGEFIISWAGGNNIKGKTSSYVQKIDANGKLLWGDNGIKLNK